MTDTPHTVDDLRAMADYLPSAISQSERAALLAVADHIEQLEAALLDTYVDASDLGLCPYALRGYPGADPLGTCGYGCKDEPECLTCTPSEGWLTQRHPVIVEIAMRGGWFAELAG